LNVAFVRDSSNHNRITRIIDTLGLTLEPRQNRSDLTLRSHSC